MDMGCNDFQLLKRVSWHPVLQLCHGWTPGLNCTLHAALLQALLNERMAPEILQYKKELVERLQAGLKRQVCVKAA